MLVRVCRSSPTVETASAAITPIRIAITARASTIAKPLGFPLMPYLLSSTVWVSRYVLAALAGEDPVRVIRIALRIRPT